METMETVKSKHQYKHHLRTSDLFRLSLRVFRTNTSRTLLTILGMAVGIGAVLFLISLGYGLQYILIGQLVTTEESLISLEAFYPGEGELVLREENLRKISELPETAEISPITELSGEVKINELSGYVLTKIIEPNYFRLSGMIPDVGRPFGQKERSVILSNTALKLIGLEENENSLGKEVFLKIVYRENEEEAEVIEIPEPLKIGGIIFDEHSPPFIFVPADILPQEPQFFSRVFVKAKDIESVEILKERLIEKGFLISARLDLVQEARRIMTIITIVLGVFGVTALVVAAIGMFNTMVIGFLERIFEVGIIKAIGGTSKDVQNLFLMESMIMGLLGGISGIALGILAGETINFGLNILAQELGGEPIRLFIYPWQFLILIIVLSIMVGFLSGFWPARKSAQLSSKEAFTRR